MGSSPFAVAVDVALKTDPVGTFRLPDFRRVNHKAGASGWRARRPCLAHKIEDEHIGMLYIVDARVPRVRLHRAGLHQAEQAGQIIDPEPRAFTAAAFSIVSASSTAD